MNLISMYWDSILLIIVFILFLFYLVKKGATRQVNEILFYLVVEAESQFGNGTGQLKYAAVVTWLYESLPAIAKILLSEKQIDIMIENAVIRMKKYLESNKEAKVLIIK